METNNNKQIVKAAVGTKEEFEKGEFFTLSLTNEAPPSYNYDYKFRHGGNQKFLKFGDDNLMPQKNIALRKSSTHNTLLTYKNILVSGNGFDIPKENVKLAEFVTRLNLNQEFEKMCEDLTTHGGFTSDIGWDASGKFIADVKHIDFAFVRKQNSPKPQLYYTCYDWAEYQKIGTEDFPKFNPETAKDEPTQIYYYGTYTQGCNFYPKPDYGCIDFIEFEIMLGVFVKNNIHNGFTPSGIFLFKEVPTKEERQLIKQNIKNDLSGPSNSGKFVALFSDGKDKAVEFIPIKSDNNADVYNSLNNLSVQKIVTGHRCSVPSIAGIPSGGLSFSNELSTGFEYYSNLNIPFYQKKLLEFFNNIFKINKLIAVDEFITIKPIMPGQFKYDGNILGNSITKNEVRKDLGLPPIEGGDVFVLPQGGNNQPPANPGVKQLPPTMTPTNDLSKSFLIK